MAHDLTAAVQTQTWPGMVALSRQAQPKATAKTKENAKAGAKAKAKASVHEEATIGVNAKAKASVKAKTEACVKAKAKACVKAKAKAGVKAKAHARCCAVCYTGFACSCGHILCSAAWPFIIVASLLQTGHAISQC